MNKYLGVLSDMFTWAKRRHGLVVNPIADVERRPQRKRGNIDVYSKEEVLALVRAAASEQDGALYLTAAFTGLRRGELLALRWRDIDSQTPRSTSATTSPTLASRVRRAAENAPSR